MWYLAYLAQQATQRRERLAGRRGGERTHAKRETRGKR
jgi:hypothetical protein